MSYKIEFELGGLPKMTNASASRHRMAQYREAQEWKRLVVFTVSIMKPPKPLKKAVLTLTRFSAVEPDSDGLVSGFKAIIDGLVCAKVLENDKYNNIGMPTYLWVKAPQKQGRVTVRVEEIES